MYFVSFLIYIYIYETSPCAKFSNLCQVNFCLRGWLPLILRLVGIKALYFTFTILLEWLNKVQPHCPYAIQLLSVFLFTLGTQWKP